MLSKDMNIADFDPQLWEAIQAETERQELHSAPRIDTPSEHSDQPQDREAAQSSPGQKDFLIRQRGSLIHGSVFRVSGSAAFG